MEKRGEGSGEGPRCGGGGSGPGGEKKVAVPNGTDISVILCTDERYTDEAGGDFSWLLEPIGRGSQYDAIGGVFPKKPLSTDPLR